MTWKRLSCYNRQSNEYWGEDKMGILDRFFKKRKKSHEPLIVFGLCGPIGVGAHKSGEAYYWTASVILRAWREENGTQLHTDKIRLEKRCDEEGVHELQNCLKGNMIFRAKVRMSEEGLELLELLQAPCRDEQLEAYLASEKRESAETADAVQVSALEKEEKKTVTQEVNEPQKEMKDKVTFGREEIAVAGSNDAAVHLFYKLKKRPVGWRNDAVKAIVDEFVPAYNESHGKTKKLTKTAAKEGMHLVSLTLAEDGSEHFTFHFTLDLDQKVVHLQADGTLSNEITECQWES